MVQPELAGDLCAPKSTSEDDAIKGRWVRVPRDLNLEAGYVAGWLVRACFTIEERYLNI